jgi:DNA-binding NarL/FixJ family response regulator
MDKLNLKVMVIESDFYALQTVNSYLAWDRRTRVVALANNPAQAFERLHRLAEAEWPDVILLESDMLPDAEALRTMIAQFRDTIKDVIVICLAHRVDAQWISAAVDAGARAYLLRNEVRLQLVEAVCYTLDREFVVTPSIREASAAHFDARVYHADILPPERDYPEMTDRIRQAIWLCVVEGMPAQLAADEMGISPHTIRSYIKEGYRILEAHDDSDYPAEMGPLERAFMRFTALDNKDEDTDPKRKSPPE